MSTPPLIPLPVYQNGLSVDSVLKKLPYNPYSSPIANVIALPNTKIDGYSPILRNEISKDRLHSIFHPQITTLFDNFNYNLKKYSKKNLLAHKAYNFNKKRFNNYYSFLTFKQVDELRSYIGSALLYLFNDIHNNNFNNINKNTNTINSALLNPNSNNIKNNFILTILAPNCYQWFLVDFACHAYSIINAPLYYNSNNESIEKILEITQSPILILTRDKILKVLNLKKNGKLDSLKILISIDPLSMDFDSNLFNTSYNANCLLYDFHSLIEIGKLNYYPFIAPTPNDVYTISFTSGTTTNSSNVLKGVQLSHANAIASLTSMCATVLKPKSSYLRSLCFLPLAHIYSRNCLNYEILIGSTIYFPEDSDNHKKIFRDIKLIKPTHFITIPRVLTQLELILKNKLNDKFCFSRGSNNKISGLRKEDYNSNKNSSFIYDKILFNRIKKKLGFEKTEIIVVGGNSIPRENIEFLSALFNIGFIQGYGLTETHSIVSQSFINHKPSFGTTGPIGPCIEVRLKNIPSLDYTWNKNKSGEILVRGPIVFQRYFRNEELNTQHFDKDGWFKTGDIGYIDDDNNLNIVDRVKNVLVLSNGKCISIDKVENTYFNCNSVINQIYCFGNDKKNYLVAIIGLDANYIINFKYKKIERKEQLKELKYRINNNLEVKKLILRDFNYNIERVGLQNYEKIHNVYFEFEPFSVIDNTITPTLKTVRERSFYKFKYEIEEMYNEGKLFIKTNL
ncbi:acetyl-CoA synthetase-like protein [Ascoidea rubescens DSM 1968]|uniref:Acetyl-CoA synthetase-like protein n=1 Tax=Ascoidea rubescens DSM 1968 TaxID=1344418 RepID=A0A1D2VNE5_9ASCO|nr:acetyl-CoA synthetase-like protein [Ascoidea rubescens DSM 1968]ODV63075.1 acetyl-CoA synthetase-like protein [Ascoidea rubescens DSM 1968]